jgi:hypothetical protein
VKFVKNCAFGISLFALAVSLTASQANAQSLRGAFNLPFEAHWGTATLEPGQYTLSLPTQSTLSPVMYVTGQGKTVMILIGNTGGTTESERSYLRIENIGQAHVVRQLSVGVSGKLFTFSVPRSVRNEASLASNMPDSTLPVVPTGAN